MPVGGVKNLLDSWVLAGTSKLLRVDLSEGQINLVLRRGSGVVGSAFPINERHGPPSFAVGTSTGQSAGLGRNLSLYLSF